MTGWKMVIALVLVLIGHTPASAATLRTSPFNSFNVERGFGRRLVTNGSTMKGTATVKLFDADGNVLDSASDAVFPLRTVNNTAAFKRTASAPCRAPRPGAARSSTWTPSTALRR